MGKNSRVTLEAGVKNSGSELLHFDLFPHHLMGHNVIRQIYLKQFVVQYN